MFIKQDHLQSRSLLVIGCGHKFFSCFYDHPKQWATTIDINADMKPDYCVDASKVIPENLHSKQFDAIILEYMPINLRQDIINLYKNLLKKNGILIILGPEIFDFNFLIEFKGILYEASKPTLLLFKGDVSELFTLFEANPIKSYLSSLKINSNYSSKPLFLDRQDYFFVPKNIAFPLDHYNREKDWISWIENYTPSTSVFDRLNTLKKLGEACLGDPKPLTRTEINLLLNHYNPGFFRKYFTEGGMTNGIKNLIKFCMKKEDLLSEKDRKDLYYLIFDREQRVRTSWNFTRTNSPFGETNKIYRQLIFRLLETEPEIQSLFREKNTSPHPVCSVGSPISATH